MPSSDPPDPGIKPTSLSSPALTGMFFTTSATWEAQAQFSIPQFCFQIVTLHPFKLQLTKISTTLYIVFPPLPSVDAVFSA